MSKILFRMPVLTVAALLPNFAFADFYIQQGLQRVAESQRHIGDSISHIAYAMAFSGFSIAVGIYLGLKSRRSA